MNENTDCVVLIQLLEVSGDDRVDHMTVDIG